MASKRPATKKISMDLAPEMLNEIDADAIRCGLTRADRIRLALCREFSFRWEPIAMNRPDADPKMPTYIAGEEVSTINAKNIREAWQKMRDAADAAAAGTCACPQRKHIPQCPRFKPRPPAQV
jgi:hypothetical protein